MRITRRECAGRECVTARFEQFIRPNKRVLSYARYEKGVQHEWIFCDRRDTCENSQTARFVACCCASQYHAYAIGKRHRREFKEFKEFARKRNSSARRCLARLHRLYAAGHRDGSMQPSVVISTPSVDVITGASAEMRLRPPETHVDVPIASLGLVLSSGCTRTCAQREFKECIQLPAR